MKGKGSCLSAQFGRHSLGDFRPALLLALFPTVSPSRRGPFYLPHCRHFSVSLIFICQSPIMPIKHLLFLTLPRFPYFSFIHFVPLSLFHFHARLIFHSSVFPEQLIHLHPLPPSPSVYSLMSLPFQSSLTHVVILSLCCDSVSCRVR